MLANDVEYAGFLIRTGAAVLDSVLLGMLILPLLWMIYGPAYFSEDLGFFAGPADFLLSFLGPAVGTILFWLYRQATPGKMAISARVVDAKSGESLTVKQSVLRYIGYFVAGAPLGIGIFWVAFDPRKQGWHDKIAGSVVIKIKNSLTDQARNDSSF